MRRFIFPMILSCFLTFFSCNALAAPIVNVYAWTGEIPDFVVQRFEKETGIKVNLSTYENNEVMYAKLRANPRIGYDVIMPSSYFVDRMRKQNMLSSLNQKKLENYHHLNPALLHPAYDPQSKFSIPFIWGITGIFVNRQYFNSAQYQQWEDLWKPELRDQLLMLDDTREVFSMALMALHYSPNDNDPRHIEAAFKKLKSLMRNIKLFSTDSVPAIIIDEDATIGMAWNGDSFKAHQENGNVDFIFPKEGYVIWVDNFSIPKYAPHLKEAYQFINFILRPDVARDIALSIRYATANKTAQSLLPKNIREDQTVYPSLEILKQGIFQTDANEEALLLFEKYWEELKMGIDDNEP